MQSESLNNHFEFPGKKVQLMSELYTLDQPRAIRFMKTVLPSDDFMRREHLLLVADINCPDIESFFNQNNNIPNTNFYSATVIFTTQDRIKVLDFVSSPTLISLRFVFKEPPLSYQNNLFLLPFKTSVWYCIGAFVLALIFIIYVNAFWEKKKLVQKDPGETVDHTVLKPNISDISLLVTAAITQQGSSIELKGTLGRLVMFLLFLAFLLLYSAYSASIVALLQSRSNQIRTLADLLNSKLDLGVEDTPYNRYFFSIATEPVRKAIYQTKIAPRGTKPKFYSLEEGVKKLQKEPFAFHMLKGTGYGLVEKYFHEHEKCGFQEINYLDDTKTYLTCRKNTPYKEMFKVGMFRIQEHGLSDRANNLIYTRKPPCTSAGGSFASVNMVDFYPVLLMFMYGIALAISFLLLEILVHRRQMQYRTKDHTLPETHAQTKLSHERFLEI
ncbi:ionotropic receptor 75a-like [Plodia interpunctella]|uniref:ionotropic receptor 75a-like n=1 Tax=Plodia interpunctella TaxID=58824 RepID=UPI003101248E